MMPTIISRMPANVSQPPPASRSRLAASRLRAVFGVGVSTLKCSSLLVGRAVWIARSHQQPERSRVCSPRLRWRPHSAPPSSFSGDAAAARARERSFRMDALVARNIAHYSHLSARNRFDEPVIEHVERVAAAVPPDIRAIAYLHDVLEGTTTGVAELRLHGLTGFEEEVLDVLTRRPGESYELYVLRVAWSGGDVGT